MLARAGVVSMHDRAEWWEKGLGLYRKARQTTGEIKSELVANIVN